jgi:hypothetical protein
MTSWNRAAGQLAPGRTKPLGFDSQARPGRPAVLRWNATMWHGSGSDGVNLPAAVSMSCGDARVAGTQVPRPVAFASAAAAPGVL